MTRTGDEPRDQILMYIVRVGAAFAGGAALAARGAVGARGAPLAAGERGAGARGARGEGALALGVRRAGECKGEGGGGGEFEHFFRPLIEHHSPPDQ